MPKKLVAILVVCVLFLSSGINAQCAMCRAVLANSENQKQAEAVNDGIVYLMVIPYLLVGVVGYFIYRSRRKVKG
ncbi:hypothetical protein [Flavobacterium silvaticum]|uniref:Uncharacterized protein n=1 Tax=Flavobacterium silvaticum TaxID=1852020 RepID=A0A972FRE5_9FLAO|nr:hypothetical protein [Flavobacterium silvaticum]NMH27113.1 hypothetical protein [Flavobacterium silvaticum]